MHSGSVRALTLLLLAAAAAIPRQATAAGTSCGSLTGLSLPSTTILSAESVPAGSFQPDNNQIPGAPPQPPATIAVPFCRVKAKLAPTADSDIRFEVWLPDPKMGWNGKFMAIGNSGLNGQISLTLTDVSLAGAVNRGYAAAGTDGGHVSNPVDGTWAAGHPQKVKDHAFRAVREVTQRSKRIISTFYGQQTAHSYFNGCSIGGREGLLEAQRYPDDYDGVIAGAPANFLTHLAASGVWAAQKTLADPQSYIPAEKLPAIASAVLAQCDALDGATDGLLEDPRDCDFDPDSIQCPASTDGPACLTPKQAKALKQLYRGPRNPRTDERIFPGLLPGGEDGGGPLGWATGITGPPAPDAPPGTPGIALLLGGQFIASIAFQNPMYDIFSFDFDHDMKAVDDATADLYNATSPNLSQFRSNGGKIILYHGYSDPIISPRNSIDYYKSVIDKVGSAKETRKFLRLFMAPGMEHCIGGKGPFLFDAVGALENWVENGVAPDQMIALQPFTGRTRPLCRFPRVAHYNGGDLNNAANFSCQPDDD